MQAHGVVGPAMENYVGALIAGSAGAKLTHEETALGQKLVAELQEKLRQYQEAMQGMAEQKAELRGALARQRADQKDVFEYLKAELLKKTDEVRALERRVAELDEVNHRQLREHEERSSAAAQAAADEQEELNQVVREQKLALDKVRRFQGRQESIDAELSEQKDRLAQQSHRHHSVINDLERKHVQEKDRLKKEMLMKLRETKASLLRMTDNHLDTTTKRTIAENEQMSSELTWQSKETVKLLDKNEKLGTVNQSLRRELSIQEETLKNLSTKVHGYQKTITALLSRLNTLDASQRAELQAFQYEEEERQREKAEDQQRIEALEEDVRRLHSQVTATQEDAQFAAAKNMEAEAKHRRMLTLQNDAVKFILRCLEDIADDNNESTPRAADVAPATLATLEASDRPRVVQYMAEQLRAHQHQLRELELQQQWQNYSTAGASVGLPPITNRSPAGRGSDVYKGGPLGAARGMRAL